MDSVTSACTGWSWQLLSGECTLFGCPAGYYRSSAAKQCAQCDGTCSECAGPSPSDCLACPSTHYLNIINGQAGDCHEKTTPSNSSESTFQLYVSANATFLADTDGSMAKPFLDLRDAIRRSDELAAPFTSATLIIYLLAANWHSIPLDPLTYSPSRLSASRDYSLTIK